MSDTHGTEESDGAARVVRFLLVTLLILGAGAGCLAASIIGGLTLLGNQLEAQFEATATELEQR